MKQHNLEQISQSIAFLWMEIKGTLKVVKYNLLWATNLVPNADIKPRGKPKKVK